MKQISERGCLRLAAVLAATLCSSVLKAAPGDITYVGGIGGQGSVLFSINDSGVSVGRSYDSSGWWHLIRYAPGGVVEDLGQLAGGHTSGYGLNSAGTIVGWGGGDVGYNGGEAFRYAGSGPMEPLGFVDGFGVKSIAKGINDAGDIVGVSQDQDGRSRAFLKRPGTPTQSLGTLGGTDSWAQGINSDGVIAGSSVTAGGLVRAFRYSGEGPMVELESPGLDVECHAGAISDSGIIVGTGVFPLDPRTHGGLSSETLPLRWDSDGHVQELGLLADWTGGMAHGINDAGYIVGERFDATGESFAALWQPDGSSVDLNQWLSETNPASASRWTLRAAHGINASGQIVGYGHYDDGPGGLPDGGYAYVLDASVVPEPVSGTLCVGGLLALFLRRTRTGHPTSHR